MKENVFFNVEGDRSDSLKDRVADVKLTVQYVLEYISFYVVVHG